MEKVSFYTLGCKVNQYETQAIKEKFIEKGYEIADENEFAHIYVINSCSVTGISDRKTRQFIRKTKKINPNAITVLTGCFAETGTKQINEISEVDIVVGNGEKGSILEEVETFKGKSSKKIIKVGDIGSVTKYDDYGLVSGLDSRTRAYIKIEDGCDRFCSYCIIPHARGPVRSRPESSIINEAKNLIKTGYKELILTGINAALYGSDSGDTQGLINLIKKLSNLPGDFRIRLSSLEPTVINVQYAKELIQIDKLCPHLHLSLQSGSNNILKSMGRRYSRNDYLEIVNVLKSKDPNYSITTDIIVGYPGETDNDFDQSVLMVNEVGFSKVHVFKYSKRTGTPAATMSNQVAPQIKNERSKKLIQVSEKKAKDFLEKNQDTIRQTLMLEYDSKSGICHGITDNNIDVQIKCQAYVLNSFMELSL